MRRRTTAPAPALVLALVLALVAAGCSEPGNRRDDGSQAGLVEGYADRLLDAGVRVLSPGAPAAAQRAEAAAALEDAGITRVASDARGLVDASPLALDPDRTAGLIDLLGPATGPDGSGAGGTDGFVVLLFDEPISAAVFAAADPEVFSDAAAEGARDGILAGSVVGYVAGDAPDTVLDRMDAALAQLAGTPATLGGTVPTASSRQERR